MFDKARQMMNDFGMMLDEQMIDNIVSAPDTTLGEIATLHDPLISKGLFNG